MNETVTAPAPVMLNREVARSENTVLVLDTLRVYPGGMLVRVVIRVSESGRRARLRIFE